MTYLQPHSRPYQRLTRITSVFASVCIIVFGVVLVFAPHFFSSLFTTIARPFWRVEFSIESGSLRSAEQLLAENEKLKNQLEELRITNSATNYVEEENAQLKMLLGRSTSTTSPLGVHKSADTTVLAAVLKRPPLSAYDELIVDVGRDMSVSTSSLVYSVGNVLIGKVIDVLDTTSKIKLYSSPGERIDVLVGSNRTPVAAVGRGGGQYEGEVSRESNIHEGDLVLSSHLNDKPFATVVSVLSDPAQTFETILFSAPVNIYQLRWVTINLNNK